MCILSFRGFGRGATKHHGEEAKEKGWEGEHEDQEGGEMVSRLGTMHPRTTERGRKEGEREEENWKLRTWILGGRLNARITPPSKHVWEFSGTGLVIMSYNVL